MRNPKSLSPITHVLLPEISRKEEKMRAVLTK